MPKYVLIGQKRDTAEPQVDEVLGYYTSALPLNNDMESFSKDYKKFFIGREEKPAKLQPVSDTELDKLVRDLQQTKGAVKNG